MSECLYSCVSVSHVLQSDAVRLVLDKSLSSLSDREVPDLLTRLGLRRFVRHFERMHVSDCVCE